MWGEKRNEHDALLLGVFEKYVTQCSPAYDDINDFFRRSFPQFAAQIKMLLFARQSFPTLYETYKDKLLSDKHVETLLYFHFEHPDLSQMLKDTEMNLESAYRGYVNLIISKPAELVAVTNIFHCATDEQFRMLDDLFLRNLTSICNNLSEAFLRISALAERRVFLRQPFVAICLENSDPFYTKFLLGEEWIWEMSDGELKAIVDKLIKTRTVDDVFRHLPALSKRQIGNFAQIVSLLYFNQPDLLTESEEIYDQALKVAITAESVNWIIIINQLCKGGYNISVDDLVLLIRRIMSSSASQFDKLQMVRSFLRLMKSDTMWGDILRSALDNEYLLAIVNSIEDDTLIQLVLSFLMLFTTDETMSIFLRGLIIDFKLPLVVFSDQSNMLPHHRSVIKLVRCETHTIVIMNSNTLQICLAPQDSKYAIIIKDLESKQHVKTTIRVQGKSFFVLFDYTLYHCNMETLTCLDVVNLTCGNIPSMTLIDQKLHILSDDVKYLYDPVTFVMSREDVNIEKMHNLNVWPEGYGYITDIDVYVYRSSTGLIKYPLVTRYELNYKLRADENRFYLCQGGDIVAYGLDGKLQWKSIIEGCVSKVKLSTDNTLRVKTQRNIYTLSRETGKV